MCKNTNSALLNSCFSNIHLSGNLEFPKLCQQIFSTKKTFPSYFTIGNPKLSKPM